MSVIYKILRKAEWEELQHKGETLGAPIDLQDGYIHFSTRDTVAETATKHFAGETDLKLLAYQADVFGDALKFEPSRGGALFPHLYAPLPLDKTLWVRDLPLDNGLHQFPKDLP